MTLLVGDLSYLLFLSKLYHHVLQVLDPELVKGTWTREEDELVVDLVARYGPKKWSLIASHLTGRIGKQCRERWHNHLNPHINKDAWSEAEVCICCWCVSLCVLLECECDISSSNC